MQISRKTLADFYVYAILFISAGTLEALAMKQSGSATDAAGSPIIQLLWAVFYVALFVRLLPRYPLAIAILKQNKAFVALLALTLFSALWSLDPGTTVRRAIPVILSSLFGLDFACSFTLEEQLVFARKVLPLVLVIGTICQVVFPGLVPSADFDPGGGWNGVASTKNTWARLVVLTGVCILCRPRGTPRSRLITNLYMVAIVALTIASRAVGGLVILGVMIVLVPVYENLRWRKKSLIVAITIAITVVSAALTYVVSNFDSLTRAAGKDATMTGRIPMWQATMVYVWKQPILGYGYAAFWSHDSRPGWLVREEVGWLTMPHSHNGYIEVALAMGFVGLGLYFYSYFLGMKRAVRYIQVRPGRESVWPLSCITLAFLYQLTESSIIAGNTAFWILYSAVIFSLGAAQMREDSPAVTEQLPELEAVTAT